MGDHAKVGMIRLSYVITEGWFGVEEHTIIVEQSSQYQYHYTNWMSGRQDRLVFTVLSELIEQLWHDLINETQALCIPDTVDGYIN